MRVGIWLATICMASSAVAGGLSSNYDFDNTDVLPKGIRSPRYKGISTALRDKYDNRGNIHPMGQGLNSSVSFQNLVDAQATQKDKAMAEGSIKALGFNLGGSPGSTTGVVEMNVMVHTPIFSYGISNTTSLAVVVPVYEMEVKAQTGFSLSPSGKKWLDTVGASQPRKAQQIAQSLNGAINNRAEAAGMQRIESQKVSAIGDIKLVSKHLLMKKNRDALGLKTWATLPTGTKPNADQLVDPSTGDGQFDLAARVLWDHTFSRYVTLSSYGTYLAQLPDELDRRIPQAKGDPVSPDKELVYRDMGDQIEFMSSVNVKIANTGFVTSLGYAYQYMMPTRFNGTRYEKVRYKYLEDMSPEQELHNVIAGVTFSTTDWYLEKKFSVPMTFSLVASHPIQGRNTYSSDIYTAEFILYF